MNIELVSVDVWRTLLNSNPNTANERARSLIKGLFNREATLMEISGIKNAYNSVGEQIDAYETRKGLSVPFRRRHELVLETLGVNTRFYDSSFYQNEILVNNYLRYKPTLVNPVAVDFIKTYYRERYEKVLVLTNTKYASGVVVGRILQSYGLDQEISIIASDRTMSCKPNPSFYKNAYGRVNPQNILHIGDSLKLDIAPVKALGGNTYQIQNSSSWNTLNSEISWKG